MFMLPKKYLFVSLIIFYFREGGESLFYQWPLWSLLLHSSWKFRAPFILPFLVYLYVRLSCFFIASNFTFIHSHTHNWVLFLLWLSLFILFGVISPLISSSILVTCRLGEFIFQCPISLPLHTVHGVLEARLLKWFAIPFSSVFSELSTMTCLPWVALRGMTHSFIGLDRAVVHVIRLVGLMWLFVSFYLPSDGEG